MALTSATTVGSNMIRDFSTIAELRKFKPTGFLRIKTSGALVAGDGGSGDWVFDATDQSTNVSKFPRLFLAPDVDPTGSSGAWRLNLGGNIPAISYGLGLSANKALNKEILEQLNEWNVGKRRVLLPATSIHVDSLKLKYNPNWEGVFGATASASGGAGTVFLFETLENSRSILSSHLQDMGLSLVEGSFQEGATVSSATQAVLDSTTGECYFWSGSSTVFPKTIPSGSTPGSSGGVAPAAWSKVLFPCIAITPATPTGRITGLSLKNITLIGKDFFERADISTFARRTDRQAFSVKNTGGQVDVCNTFAIGFTQAYKYDELWDGIAQGVRALYCGAPDGSVPAVWMGSTSTDNTNNMKFIGMHLEFCPFSLLVGVCRNVHFYGFKHESARMDDATHWGVNITIGALEVDFTGAMFVTTHTTLQPLVLNQGISCKIQGDFIARTPDATSKYRGVVWYLGNRVSEDTGNVLMGCKFTSILPSDGTTIYPVQLGNYEVAQGLRFSIPTSVTYSGGTTAVTHTGLVSCGNGSVVSGLSVNPNSNAKTGGALIKFDGTGASVSGISLREGASVYALFSGNNNNYGKANYNVASVSNNTNPDARGREMLLITASSPLSITEFTAFAGQEFDVVLNTGSVTLVNGANLVLTGGTDLTLAGGKVYSFRCTNSGNRCIQKGS